MKKVIRIPAAFVLFASSFLTVQAGSLDTTSKEIQTAATAGRADSSFSPKKICSCQLMNTDAGKVESQLIGIFAEKTLDGKPLNNYRIMNEFIRREKIYFKIVFVRSMELKEEIKAETDCMSLYNKLKKENSGLRMYNIIDVDILSSLVKQ
jgi:hypothetical protein